MNERALVVQQKAVTLKKYLNSEAIRKSLDDSVPQWLTVDRLLRVFMGAVNKNPALLDCTHESILISCMQCAQLGLEPILGRAWLVPYNNNKNINGQWIKVKECHMQPGYQGLIDLARRSNTISDVYGLNVFENDDFDISFGTDRYIRHKPWYMSKTGKPGDIIGAYVVWVLKDGTSHPEFMHISDIHKRRDRSQAYQYAESGDPKKGGGKKDSVWHQWPDEMNLKTIVKHSSKMVPASIEFMQAVEVDDASELGKGPYLPDASDMFLPQIQDGEGSQGNEGETPSEWNLLKDKLLSRGASEEQINEFIAQTAEENNMSIDATKISAIEEKEAFIKAVINSLPQSRSDDEKLQAAQAELEKKREQAKKDLEERENGDLEKPNMIEWLRVARPSTSFQNAQEWLKQYKINEETINLLEDRTLRDQLQKKKGKVEQYIADRQPPEEPPMTQGANDQNNRRTEFNAWIEKVIAKAGEAVVVEACYRNDYENYYDVPEVEFGIFKTEVGRVAEDLGILIDF